jgi:hypothetical protein
MGPGLATDDDKSMNATTRPPLGRMVEKIAGLRTSEA